MGNKLHHDSEVAAVLTSRLNKLVEGLPEGAVASLLEELIDDYCMAQFGLSITAELREVQLESKGQSICIQRLANKRAVLISSYGFHVKKEQTCDKCDRVYVCLDEKTKEEFEKGFDNCL